MFKFVGDNSREFWQGFTATGITGGTIIFTSNIFLDSVSKIVCAALVAAVGGLGAALASDIYKHHIQKKLFKQKQDEQNKKDERVA